MSSINSLSFLLLGSSGLTGKAVLDRLIQRPEVADIHLPLRNLRPKEWGEVHSLARLTFSQVANSPPFFSEIPRARYAGILCCLGTTIKKAGSRTAFREIDLHAVLEVAQWAHALGVPHFSVVSSLGAHPRSGNFYLQTKGEMEEKLRELQFPSTSILRPGLLLGNRQEFRPAEWLGQRVLGFADPILRGPFKNIRGTRVEHLADLMVSLALKPEPGFRIFENI
jgi:uncharacterized protein YbjT (DUF2867 family)